MVGCSDCDLILEQRVACFNGCKHYNINEITENYKNYNDTNYFNCLDVCEDHYYIEFNEKGSISLCRYWNYTATQISIRNGCR